MFGTHLIAFLILLLCTFIHNANKVQKEQKVDVINVRAYVKYIKTLPRDFELH